jgi:RNA exonuclease 4
MVGTGANGKRSVLARACVVDWEGKILYDAFVQVGERVTDFRTQFSGVRPKDLQKRTAVKFADAASSVARWLKGRTLVGHALRNDLKVLLLSHPRNQTRDTASYRPLMRYVRGKFRPRKLRDLAKEHLGLAIQGGEHTPDEDARAAMLLYRSKRSEWEANLKVFRGEGLAAPKPLRQERALQKQRLGGRHAEAGDEEDDENEDEEEDE